MACALLALSRGMKCMNTCVCQASIDEIKKQMDLSQCKPATLDLINRLVAASAGGQSSDIAIEQRDKAMETVEEMKSLLHQVGKLGYSVDATLARKESAEMCFFRVMSMDDETVTMVEMCEGHDGPAHDVPLADLMDQYRVHKGKVLSLIHI